MALTIEERLSCEIANKNALKEEIDGLHLYINSLHKKLGMPPKFKGSHASQQANPPDRANECQCADHQGGPCSFCMEAKHGI